MVFAPHNLLVDPPFSRVDLVLCRNLLIYLQRDLQPDIIELFHYSLNPKGWLILGTAESIDNSELFTTENKANGIYRKHGHPAVESRLSRFPFSRAQPRSTGGTPQSQEFLSFGAIHHRMVERYAPPSMLINGDNKVVHLSERAGRYLLHPGGVPTSSVFKLVREELQVELQSALQATREKGDSYISNPVALNIDGEARQVVIQARSSHEEDSAFVLVIFDERRALPENNAQVTKENQSKIPARELQTELELTKRRLHAAVEEYEASQEDMRATNEELQSANEELRSTLEELETSKEELQSINEELQTANQENRHKVTELSQLSDDLQHLMSATHIATLFLDKELRILRFTPQVAELFSLRAVDRGRPLSDLTHHLIYEDLISDAHQVLSTLMPLEREVTDKAGKWYLAGMRPYRTSADLIEGVVLTFVDVTSRLRSEEALRQSEERYRTLFNEMDEGFCVVEEIRDDEGRSVDCRILEANPAFIAYTGLGDAVGSTLNELDAAYQAFWIDVCARLKDKERLERFECQPTPSPRWYEVFAFRLPENKRSTIAILLKDISQNKETEAALRESSAIDAFRITLTDALRSLTKPDEIRATSCRLLSNHLHVVDVAYIALDGSPPQNALEQDPAFGTCRPWQDNEALLSQLARDKPIIVNDIMYDEVFDSEQSSKCLASSIRAFVIVPICQDGQLVSVFCVHNSRPHVWKDTEISLIEETAERGWSSSERARAEQALRARELALRHTDQHKNEFLAVLSHELRNPLTPITSSLRILENSEPLSEASMAAQEVIQRQVALLTRLVNDLLDLTRVARGKVQVASESVNLNQLVVCTVNDHRTLFEQKGIALEIEIPTTDVFVHGDANRLAQSIGNLLQNSAKFTGNGGRTTVTVSKHDEHWVTISIADTGTGMTTEVLQQLFQPFMQGNPTLDRNNGGLGLGLALSKHLVELHGGRVRATSEGIDLGAEFVIELPILEAPQGMQDRNEPEPCVAPPQRILIIEDNVDAAVTLSEVLKYDGHTLAVAHESQEGIQRAREFKPDTVLCDIGLPGLDGYAVASAFREDPQLKHVRLIALSGYAMPEDCRRTFAAGFDFHLAKPPDMEQLQRLLAKAPTKPAS